MPAQMMDWVVAYLEQDEDIVVPIKKMWAEWRSANAEPGLAEFSSEVLADARIEEMGGVDHHAGMEWMSPEDMDEYERDMEKSGFYSGPRVKLKSRPLTLDHIARTIKKHNDRLQAALEAARRALPEDAGEQEEGALIDLMIRTKQLREMLREAGLEASDDAPDQPPDPSTNSR